jgi:hypothetical protein
MTKTRQSAPESKAKAVILDHKLRISFEVESKGIMALRKAGQSLAGRLWLNGLAPLSVASIKPTGVLSPHFDEQNGSNVSAASFPCRGMAQRLRKLATA